MAITKGEPSSYDWDTIREIRKVERDQRWLSDWGCYLYGDNAKTEMQKNSEYLIELYDELPSEFRALI